MTKVLAVVILLAALAAEALCDLPVIYPTYQTTREIPKTRSAREVSSEEDNHSSDQYQGQYNGVPVYEEGRFARSVDSPSARRHGGSHSTSSGSRDTGPTHPGYNRRNSRSTHDEPLWLHKGDDVISSPSTGKHLNLPMYIDDIRMDPNRRYARSMSEESDSPGLWEPRFPKLTWPKQEEPQSPDLKMPIYLRNRRDFQYPKWNPHVPSGPWQKIPTRKH